MAIWLDKLIALFSCEELDEVFLNGVGDVGLLIGGKHRPGPSLFTERDEMILALQELALEQGVRLDPLAPAAGGFLKEASLRWHGVIPPMAPQGPLFLLRKHRFDKLEMAHFAIEAQAGRLLVDLLRQPRPLLICGETGSGKTSLLTALLKACAWEARVLVLEELEELPLLGPHWVRLLTREPLVNGRGGISVEQLVRESLRLRPDWLVFGELRSSDLYCFFQALASGCRQLLATLHAANVHDIHRRFAAYGIAAREWDSLDLHCLFLERGNPPRVVAAGAVGRSELLN